MHRAMTKEAIEARYRHALELMQKYPEMTMAVLRLRTGVGKETIQKLRAEMRRWSRVE